ncbi:LIM/homeobox protein Lhx4-like [Dreissena polymorpha]|uniref:Homeobox domain-containing protein n=1 Tax=Dreissena polymorpha TaxID=45954 RepID=A0A9D4LGJ5_DREPO|nr:LIM/homeobox protein Lhx4-like [Dreissena polymorpha]KAH3857695.1 hypothetical protein DPMN_100307 [Dreissena polymorpha]
MDVRKQFLRVKKKRKRTVITPEEMDTLETAFRKLPRPDRFAKITLAKELGKTENFVSIWFQNRRARERRLSQPTSDIQGVCTQTDGTEAGGSEWVVHQSEPLDLSDRGQREAEVTLSQAHISPTQEAWLFGRIIRMAAAAEGGILPTDSPHLEEAMMDACRGITLRDGRLLYHKDTGFQIDGLQH